MMSASPVHSSPPSADTLADGRRSPASSLILLLYRRLGSERFLVRLRRLCLALEDGPGRSLTIREIFSKHYRVQVGLHTLGPCSGPPKVFHSGTSFGRYAYVAESVRTFTRNHPFETKSTHGLFYNAELGRVKGPPLKGVQLRIGNGVWIDHNAIILPPTESIGEGAVIMAGAVIYTNVPPYAIVSGFPARTIGYRFPKPRIEELIASRWWELPPAKLDAFQRDAFLAREVTPPVRNTVPA